MVRSAFLVVEAKLARPRLPRIVDRPRLLDRLRGGVPVHPLSLVIAGAGYGKTTLVASLAELDPESTLWYSLGEEDADITLFLRHVAAALQRRNRRHGRSLRALLEEGAVEARSVATAAGALLNDLQRIREPVTFVMDDFHLVAHSPEVAKVLSIVVENNRSPVHFVLASRTEPPLPLGRLRARGQLLEIGSADLAFNVGELRLLLEEIHHRTVSEEEIDFAARFTEGWVTPIQLALQGWGAPGPVSLSRALERAMGSGAALHDYLAGEILDRQPESWRRWLLQTSPFEEIDPQLLREVLGETDPEERLRELLRRSLIQAFEGESGVVYRYHALLRDLLHRRFCVERPVEERERIHRTAAALFRRRGDVAGAARQLALLDDREALAGFLREEALTLLDAGHYQALSHWLSELPPGLLEEDPWLRLRRGDARHFLGDWPGAEIDFERARRLFLERGDLLGEAWTVLGLARIWNLRGQAEEAAREGEAALARLSAGPGPPPEELEVRLLKVVSGAHFYGGRYSEALRRLDRLEELARGHADRQAVVWNNRAVIHASQGNYQAAADAFEKGLRRPGARRSPRAPLHLSNLALLLTEMGDTERAQPLFDEALRRARRSQNRSQILSAIIGQAHLYYRLGNVEACLERLRQAEELNAELGVALIASDALALRGRVLCDAGQFAPARESVRQALAAYGAAARDATWLLYRVEAAVIDLRAGRLVEAHTALTELKPAAFGMEAMLPRMRLLFHRGEAARRLDLDHAADELAAALALGREYRYDAFLRSELRRDVAPFLFLLGRGIECDTLVRLAAGAGASLELDFLPLVGRDTLPVEAGRAVLNLLAEIGGPAGHRRIATSAWAADGPLARTARNTLEALERRHPELRGTRTAGRAGLTLTTLGRLKLAGPRGEIGADNWTSQRALSIFLYLALRGGRGVSRDRLIELFWPGGQRRSAAKNFHPTLSYVRRALREVTDGPVVVVVNGLYQLDPDLPLTIDARRFEALAAEGRNRGRRRERIQALEEAAALYRGDFLEEREEPWAEEVRSQLALRHEGVLADLAGLHEEGGLAHRAVPLYRKLLELNPFREEIHVRLMVCYHQSGDRHAVRDHFQRLTRLLHEELGVEPLPETTRSYESLIATS